MIYHPSIDLVSFTLNQPKWLKCPWWLKKIVKLGFDWFGWKLEPIGKEEGGVARG